MSLGSHRSKVAALAALAATGAFAQSTVSLSGLFDLGVSQVDYKGQKVTTTGVQNGTATSYAAIAGSEDIGGGLKADFRWEFGLDLGSTSSKTAGTPATGVTSNVTSFLANGNSFLGLSGAFGAVKFGTPNAATLSINGDGNGGFATAVGSGYRVTSFDATRFQNSLRYDTPNFNGFGASLLYSAKNDKIAGATTAGWGSAATGNAQNQQNGRDQVQEIGLSYANGPLTVRYADLQTKQYAGYNNGATTILAANGAAFTLKSFSAKYDINTAASLSYFYQRATSDSIILTGTTTTANSSSTQIFNRTTNGIAGSYLVTPALKLMASYQVVKLGDNDGITKGSGAAASVVSPVGGEKTTVLGLGVDYALSKRTTLYARYEKDNDKAIVRAITGFGTNAAGDYTATAVGVRHSF